MKKRPRCDSILDAERRLLGLKRRINDGIASDVNTANNAFILKKAPTLQWAQRDSLIYGPQSHGLPLQAWCGRRNEDQLHVSTLIPSLVAANAAA